MNKTIENNFHAKEQEALARALQGLTQQSPVRQRKRQKDSGVPGIYWHSSRNHYAAHAVVDGKRYYAGSSKDLEAAKAMVKKLETKIRNQQK